MGQTPTQVSGGAGELFEDLACHVSFQAADHFQAAEPFASAASHVAAGFVVAAHPGQHDAIQRRVGVAVTTPVESIADGRAVVGSQMVWLLTVVRPPTKQVESNLS